MGFQMFFQYCARSSEAVLEGGVAEVTGEGGDGEFGGDVFECVGGGAPRGRAGGDVVEFEPLIEAGALADAFDGAAVVAEVFFGGDVGSVHERLQCGVGVEGAATEGIDVGNGGGCGIAVHDVRRAAHVGPAVPTTIVLLRLVIQALRDVARAFGVEPSQQLEL